jgi:hypothetical protein
MLTDRLLAGEILLSQVKTGKLEERRDSGRATP